MERFFEAATDGHGFTDRFHRCGENRRTAFELFKGKARNLRDDVIDRGFEASRCLACDVVENFVEGVSNGKASSNFRDGKPCCFAGKCRRSTHPRVHFDHHHIAVVGVDGELNVAASRSNADFTNDGDGLIAKSLVFPIGEGLGWSNSDRIPGMYPHRVEVFDAADDHDVVRQITHHLEFKFFPTEQ